MKVYIIRYKICKNRFLYLITYNKTNRRVRTRAGAKDGKTIGPAERRDLFFI